MKSTAVLLDFLQYVVTTAFNVKPKLVIIVHGDAKLYT